MKKEIFFAVFIVLLSASSPLFAEDSDKLVFNTIKLTQNNNPAPATEKVSIIIAKKLKDEDFFRLNSPINISDEISFQNCLKHSEITKLENRSPNEIVIIISITDEIVKIGEKQLSRYAVENITETRYTITVGAAELQKEKFDLLFKETYTDLQKIETEADLIADKIREFYIKRKPAQKPLDYYNITGISLNLSLLYPFGRMGDIADYGYGAEASLNGSLWINPLIIISPAISVYGTSSDNSNINSAYIFIPEIKIGYIFPLTEKINLTPHFGAGYSLMLIDGITESDPGNSKQSLYYNPEFKAGIETSYLLTENYSLLFDISYGCIAEMDSLLQFSSFNIGIRKNLK